MARSHDMQQALDIVAGRKPAEPAARSKWSTLERFGVLLWVGVESWSSALWRSI